MSRKNAPIAVIGYGKFEAPPEIDPIIKQLHKKAFGSYYTALRKYFNGEYETIPFQFEEIPSPRFSIPVKWTPDRLEGYFNSWSAIQKIKEEEGAIRLRKF